MSFGIGVGDIITVTKLARQLYKDVYQVARKAPEQIRALSVELGALSTSLELLSDEIQSPDSILTKSGAERTKTIKNVVQETEKMLKEMSKTMEKYEIVNADAAPSKLRRMFAMSKYPLETSTIDNFRARMAQQYGYIQLLLTSAGNSSLERIEAALRVATAQFNEQKRLMEALSEQVGRIAPATDTPTISGVEARDLRETLSRRFMESAESKGSWLAIGLDDWIQAGKWWLMKSQVAIRRGEGNLKEPINTQAYVNLLKASWILLDVIKLHPQRTYTHSGTKQLIIKTFAGSINAELNSLKDGGRSLPSRRDILNADLSVWVNPAMPLRLELTRRASTKSETPFVWGLEDRKVVYQVFAEYRPTTGSPVECVVIACYDEEYQTLHLYGQTFTGLDVFYIDAQDLWFARLRHDGRVVRKYQARNAHDSDSEDESDDDSKDGSDATSKGSRRSKSAKASSKADTKDSASEDESDSSTGDTESTASEDDERGLTLTFDERQDTLALFTFLRGYDTSSYCFQPDSRDLPDFLAGSLLCEIVESHLYLIKGEQKNTSNKVELGRRVREIDDAQASFKEETGRYNEFVHLARMAWDRSTEGNTKPGTLMFEIAKDFKLLVRDIKDPDNDDDDDDDEDEDKSDVNSDDEDVYDDVDYTHVVCGLVILLMAMGVDYKPILKDRGFMLYTEDDDDRKDKDLFPPLFRMAWTIRHETLLREIVDSSRWNKAWTQSAASLRKKNPFREPSGRAFIKILQQELKKHDEEAIVFLLKTIPEFQRPPDFKLFKLEASDRRKLMADFVWARRLTDARGITGTTAKGSAKDSEVLRTEHKKTGLRGKKRVVSNDADEQVSQHDDDGIHNANEGEGGKGETEDEDKEGDGEKAVTKIPEVDLLQSQPGKAEE